MGRPPKKNPGEYDVLAVDYAKNIVKIGNGKETLELPSEHVKITWSGIGRRPVAA